MQNETITIGFTDSEPRVYVNGELRKSTLDVTWDEDGAIEKVYLVLKPKPVPQTSCGEPVDSKASIAVERIDGNVAHLRHKDCPAGSGGVGVDAALPDRTWLVPFDQLHALIARCPGCNGTFPVESESVEYTSRGADEVVLTDVVGKGRVRRGQFDHRGCPKAASKTHGHKGCWEWEQRLPTGALPTTVKCAGCQRVMPIKLGMGIPTLPAA